MASFLKYLDSARQFRSHVKNQYFTPPAWMFEHLYSGPLGIEFLRHSAKIPKAIFPNELLLKAVVSRINEFQDFDYSPVVEGTDKFWVHPARRVAHLVEKYLTIDQVNFNRAIDLAYLQLLEERRDLDMQAALAKQDAVAAGVYDGGWSGYLAKSAEAYDAVRKRRDAHAKGLRIKRFTEICDKKLQTNETLAIQDFADIFDQSEMRQTFQDYPKYRHLYPKQWYLIPPLPERIQTEWPPANLTPEDPEHQKKVDAVLRLDPNRDTLDEARLDIMRQFYDMSEWVDQQREGFHTQVDVAKRVGEDTTDMFKRWVRYRKNGYAEPETTEPTETSNGKLEAVKDIDVFDPVYWASTPSKFLAASGEIDTTKLTPEEQEEYELLVLKGREMAYQVEKEFKPRSPEFLSEHDELYGSDVDVPKQPERMAPPRTEEDILAFSPKYIRKYFPEAFRQAIKYNKQRMAEFQKESNLTPTDQPYAGLWRVLKKKESDQQGQVFDSAKFQVPDWEYNMKLDPEVYQRVNVKEATPTNTNKPSATPRPSARQ